LDNKNIEFIVTGKSCGKFNIPTWQKYFPMLISGSSLSTESQDVTANFGVTAFKNPVPDGFLPFDTCSPTGISLGKNTDTLM